MIFINRLDPDVAPAQPYASQPLFCGADASQHQQI